MSLLTLTRSSFQNGIPPAQVRIQDEFYKISRLSLISLCIKWLGLCKLCISKEDPGISKEHFSNILCNSVISLFRSYPGHVVLRSYLEHAISDSTLTVPVFTTVFLQAARSPELQDAATLDLLCRIALNAHYSSQLASPIGSVVSYTESPIVVLGIVQDALALLRTAYSFPVLHSHQLISSAGELVILLLSCVTDTSQISTAQAMVNYQDANDILQTLRLSSDVRQVLETFVMSLTLVIGDDAKVARETQMMQSMLAMAKSDLTGSNTSTGTVICSLLLHGLLSGRAGPFGAGSGPEAVACLLCLLRWTSWTPTTFYTQMILSAFTSVSQCNSSGSDTGSFFLWRAFVVGRLPKLLLVFEKTLEKDGGSQTDWRAAMQAALISVVGHSDLIAQCDHIASQSGARNGSENMHEDPEAPRSFVREFLQHLVIAGLIDNTFSVTMDPMISNEYIPRLRLEAQEAGIDLEVYIESKLTPEGPDDSVHLVERICRDPGCHASFAEVVKKRFALLPGASDVDTLSHLSRLLYSNELALDIVSLHVKISEITAYALHFLSDYDCETVGDPQTAVSHLGDVVLFVQSALARFQLTPQSCKTKDNGLPAGLLWSPAIIYAVEEFAGENATAFAAWFKALFDSSSEGIEDTILRSTKPVTLLQISATLFSHAISARAGGRIDADVLNNGVSYFTGPLLNWTLVGVVKALLREIQQKGASAGTHLEVLQTLLLSPTCPGPVLNLCSAAILRLLLARRAQGVKDPTRFNSTAIRRLALKSMGQNPDALSVYPPGIWMDQPRQAIRDALQLARAGKAPSIDVDRCLAMISPSAFIHLLWSELSEASRLGQMEICKQMGTFILVAIPRTTSTPRLLPIFMHLVLPSLITTIDRQLGSELHAMNTELLVGLISSVLTAAFHLEWAVHTVCEDKHMLNPTSMYMTRRLASDLRGNGQSRTSTMIARGLAGMPSFVANFPVFMLTEI